jgi:hypothetical protein
LDNPNALLTKIEQARMWAYFHKDWLLQMREQLHPQLPPEFHIFVESEAILISPDDPVPVTSILPDVSVALRTSDTEKMEQPVSPEATNAVIEIDEPFETYTQYTLLIRRAPENLVVATLEILPPSNKGLGNRFDQEKHLRKRDSLLDAGINLLEVDALLEGDRTLPTSLAELAEYDRNSWTASHFDGRRKLRGWGWNQDDPLPSVSWTVANNVDVLVNLSLALEKAREFNRWGALV